MADGTEITHHPTLKFFARSLQKDEQGYFLKAGQETKRITVEDTPYFVIRIDSNILTLNDERQVPLDPITLRYAPGRLTCRIPSVFGLAEAKFLRAPYYDVMKTLEQDQKGYWITIQGCRILLKSA